MSDPIVRALERATHASVVRGALADRLTWAGDASIYRLVPRVVVFPRHEADVQAILRVASQHQAPLCFRAGGTSLSGQAVTDGILVVVSRHLRRIEVHPGADRVSAEPGAVGAWVNAALAPHGRRIGPDPASLQAAEIGGIVANNASGMCCGVAQNSYHTVTGLELVLADGTYVDTAAPDADERLWRERPEVAQGLLALAADLRGDEALARRVRASFETKNTVGYGLNALLDADTPAGILQRVVVGSEGTLAFIARATFRTLPLPRHRATAWLLFPDVEAAAAAVPALSEAGAAAIELLDAVALRRVADRLPDPVPPGEPAALLIEVQEAEEDALQARSEAIRRVLAGLKLAAPAELSRDPARQAAWWSIRKGLFPSVGAVRAKGTAVLIEDVTFPRDRLAEGVRALRACFRTHGYDDAVVFGHARDGNLHFTLTPDLSRPEEIARYDAFMQDLVALVLARGGHLKAEHGTGRNMAPFVQAQWGPEALGLMQRLKRLLDPEGLLNPGVVLSDDPRAHLAHLKTLPPADPLVDACIECGFCEPVCPSRDATLSPRQRITALRWMRAGGAEGRAMASVWQHRGLDTCATDGLCRTACPVGIDTGDLVKAERAAGRGPLSRRAAAAMEQRLGGTATLTRVGLGAMRLSAGRLPGRAVPVPPPAPRLPAAWPEAEPGAPTFVYLPTCLTRTMGPDPVPAQLAALCSAAGVGLRVPARADALCCGQPFESKGFPEAAAQAAERTARALVAGATEHGAIAGVVTDTSTCAGQLERASRALPASLAASWEALPRLHPAAFARDVLIPRLEARGRLSRWVDRVVVHPTCSEQKAGWASALREAAGAAAWDVVVPAAVGCCGMAGDRGWIVPELTAAATAREAEEVRARGATLGVSTSVTCGAALAASAGVDYRHLFTVLAEALVHQPSASTEKPTT